jgi:hypothetical protein
MTLRVRIDYRKRAQELRSLADGVQTEEAREALLQCADEYDRLAVQSREQRNETAHPNQGGPTASSIRCIQFVTRNLPWCCSHTTSQVMSVSSASPFGQKNRREPVSDRRTTLGFSSNEPQVEQ